MTEVGEYAGWEGGEWGTARRARPETSLKPKPEHDIDTVDIMPSNSNPADHVEARRIGSRALNPDRSFRWD